MEFHEKIQELRKQKGLTQEELAQSLFVSRTAISKWESGRGYPNIDSLKAIAKFFGVTVDDLLSGDELLTIAQEDTRQQENRYCDLVFGLLDCSAFLFWILPLFGQKTGETIHSVSLQFLAGIAPYLKTAYTVIIIGMAAAGILTLALQNSHCPVWIQKKRSISLLLNAAGVLLFIISQQPYAAVFLLLFLTVKVLMLIKKP